MPVTDLLVVSLLLVVIIGGIGWTKLQLWDWLKERDDASS